MTYCLGILLPSGLVFAADARSNAGVDHIASVCKLNTLVVPGERMIAIQSAGNLATSQSVVTEVMEAAGSGGEADLRRCKSMFEAARVVGQVLRKVHDADAKYVEPYGDPSASFL